MIDQKHEYAIPLDEYEPDPAELEGADLNDPQLAEPIFENPEGDAYAPSMLRETVSYSGEVTISLGNFSPLFLL
jgi:hypothetical protein